MTTDLPTLLRRDHAEFHRELTLLLDPSATRAEIKDVIDGLRLGLTAHAEAEDIVLGRFERITHLRDIIAEVRTAHLAQERALAVLVSSRPDSDAWRIHAHYLRELVGYHARHEQARLMPALRDAPGYTTLAGLFATERLRQIGMLAPSGPIYIPERLASGSGDIPTIRSEDLAPLRGSAAS